MPNISYMWHAMGLNSEMDNHLDETRPDHQRLFNLRYLMCKPGTESKPSTQISETLGGHAIFEWTSAKGYFSIIQLAGCINGYSLPKVRAESCLIFFKNLTFLFLLGLFLALARGICPI